MESFKHDQLLHKMREKYGRLINDPQKNCNQFVRNNTSQQNYLYQTPIKNDKNISRQIFSSSNAKTLPIKSSLQQKTERFGQKSKYISQIRNSQSVQRQIEPSFVNNQSENINNLRDKLLKKQKIMTEKMKQNEKAIRMSKQFRNSERSNKSQQHTLESRQNFMPADLNLQYYSSTRRDKFQEKGYKYNQSARKSQINISSVIENAEAAFRQKINCLVNEKQGRNKQNNQVERIKRPQSSFKTDYKPNSVREHFTTPEYTRQQRDNLTFAFQNTSKIHERIQALLSR